MNNIITHNHNEKDKKNIENETFVITMNTPIPMSSTSTSSTIPMSSSTIPMGSTSTIPMSSSSMNTPMSSTSMNTPMNTPMGSTASTTSTTASTHRNTANHDTKTVTSSKKLSHIDGLRGWASLCVFIGHVGSRLSPGLFWNPNPPFYSNASIISHVFLGMGGFPIVIFFMLSGRVLALSFLKNRDFKRLASAAIRRPFRLVFPVYVALFFYLLFQAADAFNPNISKANFYVNATSGPVYEWFPLLDNSNRIQNFSQFLADPITLYIAPYKVPPNPGLSVYWTLPIEFIYSYIVFIMALTTTNITHQKWLFFLIIIIFDWLNSLNSWLSPFAVGLWIAEVAQTGYFTKVEKGFQGYLVRFVLFSIGFTAVLYNAFKTADTEKWFSSWTFNSSGIITPHPKPDYNQMLPLTLLVGTCLMLLLETSSWLRFCFGNPIMEFFGKISFGVYLLHPTLVVSLGSFLIAKYYDPAAGYSQTSATAIVFITLLAAIIPLSWIFYHVADKPSIWIGRQVESLVFDTEWSFEAFLNWFKRLIVALPYLPSRAKKYIHFHVAEGKAYVSRKSKRIHVAVFGILGFVDFLLLLIFVTMRTGSSSTLPSPTFSGSSLSFKSLNNPSWNSQSRWSSVRTLITLGDSWTDTAFNLSNPPTPSNPIGSTPMFGFDNYWGLSGTDGPNWVYGLTAQYNQSTILTYNFASAGAVVDSLLITPFRDSVLDMKAQVSTILSYFSNASSSDRQSTMIAIMLGGNDVGNTYSPLLYAPTTSKPTVIVKGRDYPITSLYPELISVYFDQISRLYNAGYRNFFLINAPPLDKSPNAVDQGSLPTYEEAVRYWNSLFSEAAQNYSTTICKDCTFFHYDLNSFLTFLLQPPVASSINVTITSPTFCPDYIDLLDRPYYVSSNCSAPVNQYFWLNIVHPTWTVMEQMAKDMASFMMAA